MFYTNKPVIRLRGGGDFGLTASSGSPIGGLIFIFYEVDRASTYIYTFPYRHSLPREKLALRTPPQARGLPGL